MRTAIALIVLLFAAPVLTFAVDADAAAHTPIDETRALLYGIGMALSMGVAGYVGGRSAQKGTNPVLAIAFGYISGGVLVFIIPDLISDQVFTALIDVNRAVQHQMTAFFMSVGGVFVGTWNFRRKTKARAPTIDETAHSRSSLVDQPAATTSTPLPQTSQAQDETRREGKERAKEFLADAPPKPRPKTTQASSKTTKAWPNVAHITHPTAQPNVAISPGSVTADFETESKDLGNGKSAKEAENEKPSVEAINLAASEGEQSGKDQTPMPEERTDSDDDGWTEEFEILYEYDAAIKECHDELDAIENNLAEIFRKEIVVDRKKAKEIRDGLIAEYEQLLRPYAADKLNDALAKARELGPEAEHEFTRVIEVMGEDADIDSIVAVIRKKYPAEDTQNGLEEKEDVSTYELINAFLADHADKLNQDQIKMLQNLKNDSKSLNVLWAQDKREIINTLDAIEAEIRQQIT